MVILWLEHIVSLSILARLARRGAFKKFESGLESTRGSAKPPAKRGFTRGTLGVLGSTKKPATRNSNAAEDEDRQILNSPIMSAFMGGGR